MQQSLKHQLATCYRLAYHVATETAVAQPIVSVRLNVPGHAVSESYADALVELAAYVQGCGSSITGVPFSRWFDPPRDGLDGFDVEVCLPVAQLLPASAQIGSRELPPGTLVYFLYADLTAIASSASDSSVERSQELGILTARPACPPIAHPHARRVSRGPRSAELRWPWH